MQNTCHKIYPFKNGSVGGILLTNKKCMGCWLIKFVMQTSMIIWHDDLCAAILQSIYELERTSLGALSTTRQTPSCSSEAMVASLEAGVVTMNGSARVSTKLGIIYSLRFGILCLSLNCLTCATNLIIHPWIARVGKFLLAERSIGHRSLLVLYLWFAL